MYNRVLHNVAICPWAREGDKRGCTVPGTDNGEADTALNQAGLWSLPSINHVVGNRFANHFNGMFFMANFAGGAGRGAAQGLLCTEAQLLGRIQGNTMHGHGRFGTYLLGPNFPRATDQSLENNGRTDRATCARLRRGGRRPWRLDAARRERRLRQCVRRPVRRGGHPVQGTFGVMTRTTCCTRKSTKNLPTGARRTSRVARRRQRRAPRSGGVPHRRRERLRRHGARRTTTATSA